MGDQTQPTPIDSELYERLKRHTEKKHGQTRGVLREELETAIRNHVEADMPTDSLSRIENDVAHIKAQLAEAESDGGETIPDPARTPSQAESTDRHRTTDEASEPAVDPDDPPHSRATRAIKAEWLVECVCNNEQIHREKDLGSVVDDTYAFDDGPREKLIDAAIERLDHVPHPGANVPEGVLFVTPDAAERIREKQDAQNSDEATDEFGRIESGEAARADD